jgi:uncharacterized protein (DUF305 family)
MTEISVRARKQSRARLDTWPTLLRENWIAALLVAVILIGIGVFAFQMIPRDPGDNSAEAGFARDMSAHHGQAVQMALAIRDRTEDEQLHYLATDIMLTQQSEIGMMTGWLMSWGLGNVGSDDPMTWMGHPTTGLMPGMATQEQVAELSSLPVDQAEVLFLQLMIRHHQGGVEMAEAILDRTDNDMIRKVATQMVVIQDAEIDTMNQMLEARGQAPITDPLPDSHTGH